ncbi:hypothetical protein D3C81_1721820 [compost metagenome]
MANPASRRPLGMLSKPPRNTSVRYAPAYSDRVMMNEGILSSRIPRLGNAK